MGSNTAKIQRCDKRSKKYLFVFAVVVIIILLILAIRHFSNDRIMSEMDLSSVFGFSFIMTKEDVVCYELEMYGNEEYQFDVENNRLDFAPYNNYGWKHRYYFDDETELLTGVFYSGVVDLGQGDGSECKHVHIIENALLNIIGNWDEGSTDNDVRSIAYGQIDGVPCKILYYDGATQEIYIKKYQ